MAVDIDRIQKHYDHAVRKHPLFCNTLTRKSAGQWIMDESKDKATLRKTPCLNKNMRDKGS